MVSVQPCHGWRSIFLWNNKTKSWTLPPCLDFRNPSLGTPFCAFSKMVMMRTYENRTCLGSSATLSLDWTYEGLCSLRNPALPLSVGTELCRRPLLTQVPFLHKGSSCFLGFIETYLGGSWKQPNPLAFQRYMEFCILVLSIHWIWKYGYMLIGGPFI